LFSSVGQATENCVLQDKVVSRNTILIEERGNIRRDVVPYFNNQKKCLVDFRVRVGSQWHTAIGDYTWPGDRPDSEACAIAVTQAENAVREQLGKSQVLSERVLICKDRPELTTLTNVLVGQVGDAGQFRPHTEYPNQFAHNGTQCRWFIEPSFNGRKVHTFQGIVCEVQKGKWVVVDKF
jgi:hypothetical protein